MDLCNFGFDWMVGFGSGKIGLMVSWYLVMWLVGCNGNDVLFNRYVNYGWYIVMYVL